MDAGALLVESFIREHPRAAARILEKMPADTAAEFMNLLPADQAVLIIGEMDPWITAELLSAAAPEKVNGLFLKLDLQQAVILLRIINPEMRKRIMDSLPAARSGQINRLTSYIESTLGAYIEPGVLTLSDTMSVREALEELRQKGEVRFSGIYVLDDRQRLLGCVNLGNLITEDPAREIRAIMQTGITSFAPETPVLSLPDHPEQGGGTFPVADRDGVFMGVVSTGVLKGLGKDPGDRMHDLSQNTILALGELYRIGLAGLIQSAGSFGSLKT